MMQTTAVVDDLLQGMNEWRNIQDIVRVTFKALHDVVKAQGATIQRLEEELLNKATWQEVPFLFGPTMSPSLNQTVRDTLG
jgi:hypothetical protein